MWNVKQSSASVFRVCILITSARVENWESTEGIMAKSWTNAQPLIVSVDLDWKESGICGQIFAKWISKSNIIFLLLFCFSLYPPTSALKIFLNIDSGYCRHLITPILVKLWAIQKWMKVQKKFKFYSSSILIVYDCRVLKQFLEQKKLFPQESTDPLEKASEAALTCNQQPIHIYRQIQKSHSLSNDYNKVRQRLYTEYMYVKTLILCVFVMHHRRLLCRCLCFSLTIIYLSRMLRRWRELTRKPCSIC